MQSMVNHRSKVLVSGARGMLGSSVVRALKAQSNYEVFEWTRDMIDLRNPTATFTAMQGISPDFVIHCAARVGGIRANINSPADFLLENLQIDSSIFNASQRLGVKNFVYVGSSCMYPKDHRQPLVESDLLAAPLEETNEGYALSKIVGSKLARYMSSQYGFHYQTLILSNLYGPGDNFDLTSSHLVAACIKKAIVAKSNQDAEVLVWGDGTARREFTYVDEVAEWLARTLTSIENWPHVMNLGFGLDFTVEEYHKFALVATGYQAELVFQPDKPSGMRQKLMDSSIARNRFGWNPKINPENGMKLTLGSIERENLDIK
jgi:GDP-L-fucose synthase